MMTTDKEWLRKEEAAKIFSRGGAGRLSPRRVAELVHEGKLTAKRERNPETNLMTMLISRESLEKLYAERKHPKPIDLTPRANGAVSHRSQALALPKQLQQEFLAHLLRRPAMPLFLSLRAAAKFSGLPQTDLRELIDKGELPARKTRAGWWRISRVHLKQLAEAR